MLPSKSLLIVVSGRKGTERREVIIQAAERKPT
jgi:hypothetical protein